jgi:hypothetical protein
VISTDFAATAVRTAVISTNFAATVARTAASTTDFVTRVLVAARRRARYGTVQRRVILTFAASQLSLKLCCKLRLRWRFIAPFLKGNGTAMAARELHHFSAIANRTPILSALREIFARHNITSGAALEYGSGTGAHIEVFAPAFTDMTWQPSEYVVGGHRPEYISDTAPAKTASGDSRYTCFSTASDGTRPRNTVLRTLDDVLSAFGNVKPAIALDLGACGSDWPSDIEAQRGTFSAVFACNVCHITPNVCTKGLLMAGSALLRPGGVLCIYGPFKIDGKFTTESNARFDGTLRARNPEWGYQDASEIAEMAEEHNLTLVERRDMPDNNLLLTLARNGDARLKPQFNSDDEL